MGPAMEVLPFHSLIGSRCLPYLKFKSIILSAIDSGVQKLPKGGNYVITMDKRVSCALLPVQKQTHQWDRSTNLRFMFMHWVPCLTLLKQYCPQKEYKK